MPDPQPRRPVSAETASALAAHVKRAGHTVDAEGEQCNYFMKFHERSRYMCTCGFDELMERAKREGLL